MPRAILSVSDKSNLTEFAALLISLGWDLIASGGTAAELRDRGLPVTPVELVTGAPEMLGGRVKTLHPAIHAGILARDTDADMADLSAHDYAPISMVVCNLYPFRTAVLRPDITLAEAIEQIDIGGVTLLRAAAKNFSRVTVICDPQDYELIGATLQSDGEIGPVLRHQLAVKAFAHTRNYDTAIHAYLEHGISSTLPGEIAFPEVLPLHLLRTAQLRYGDNPQQSAAFYAAHPSTSPLNAEPLGGESLTYTNLLDLDAAWRAVSSWESPAVVMASHRSVIGFTAAQTLAQALTSALAPDHHPVSNSVLAVNRTVDEAFVAELADLYIEALAAPGFTAAALEALRTTRPTCCLLKMLPLPPAAVNYHLRSVRGGFALQIADTGDPDPLAGRTVTRRKPSAQEMRALRLACHCVRFVPSTAAVVAGPDATVSVVSGLASPEDAVRLVLQKAEHRAQGAVLATDHFLTHPDMVDMAIGAGISAIVQPGGALRDASVIEAADRAGIAMLFTGVRHLLH